MKSWKTLVILVLISLISIPVVYSHCPVCTAAVGTGVAVTRFYGLDDIIVGVWIGAFILSTALWFDNILKKNVQKRIPLQKLILTTLVSLSIIVPLYSTGIMDMRYNLFGVNRLLLGILIGGIVLSTGIFISNKVKEKRKGVLFPFQTIVMVLCLLTLTSFALWLLVR
jgi:hypothetical protein